MSVKSKYRAFAIFFKKNTIVQSFIPTIKISKEIKTIKIKMTYHVYSGFDQSLVSVKSYQHVREREIIMILGRTKIEN